MKILLDSYINNNLGDDLMIYIICRRYPNHSFYLPTPPNCRDMFANIPNLTCIAPLYPLESEYIKRGINKALSYLNIPKLQLLYKITKEEYDIYIQLGGSIFMQVSETAWRNKLRDYNYIVSKTPHNLIIGSSFGPFYTQEFLNEHKLLFEKFDDVIFRDTYSNNLFNNEFNYGVDSVFNLEFPHKKRENYIVFSLIDLEHRPSLSKYKDKYIQIINNLSCELAKCGFRIVFFSFCENEGDLKAIEQVIKNSSLSTEQYNIYNHKNIKKSLDIIANSNGVVATRFHSIILSFLFNKPCLPFIYHEKTTHELEDLEFRGYKVKFNELDRFDIFESMNTFTSEPKFNREKLKTASKHFEWLDAYLERKI